MEHDGLKERLIEAAVALDREGKHIRMEVTKMGIRMCHLRKNKAGNIMQTESYTPWVAVEVARQNPLLIVMRDLINQMDEQEEFANGP